VTGLTPVDGTTLGELPGF